MEPFESDCGLALDVCRDLPVGWSPLVAAFCRGPVFLVGEGSSRLLPLGLARSVARAWGGLGVDGSSGRLAPPEFDGQWVALSNSGRTREVLRAVRGRSYLAVCGVPESPLATSATESHTVLPRPERSVASTAAVLGQTLVVVESIARAHGRTLDREPLVRALRTPVASTSPPVGRLWIVGADDGGAEELALKAWEMAGLPATAVNAGLALHGLEEVLDEGDLVWLLYAHRDDREAIRRRVEATGARITELPCEPAGPLRPLLQLVTGWQILAQWARARGRNPGLSLRARKIGNEMASAKGATREDG